MFVNPKCIDVRRDILLDGYYRNFQVRGVNPGILWIIIIIIITFSFIHKH